MATIYQPSQWLIPENSNTDKVGNYSFEFDGTADFIDISPFTFTGEFSISCWVNFDVLSSDGMVLGDSANGVTNSIIYMYSSTRIYVAVAGTTTTFNNDGVTPIVIGDWIYVTIWRDSADDMHCYLDNADFATLSTVTPNNPGSFIVNRLGSAATAGGTYLNGKLSEVSMFDYALSGPQITTLYGSASAGVGNPMALDVVPIAYYKGDRAALGDQWAVPNQGVSHNYALEFNNEYVTTPPWTGYQGLLASTTSIGTVSHITLSFWFNTTDTASTTFEPFILSGIYNMRIKSADANTKGRIQLNGAASAYRIFDTDIDNVYDGNWHNLIIYIPNANPTWDLSNAKVYLDTVDLGSGVPVGSQTANEVTDIFGLLHYGPGGGGAPSVKISNWAYWLSDEQSNISAIFNNGIPGDLTSLSPTVWWKLDAGSVTIGGQVDVAAGIGSITGSGPNRVGTHNFPQLVGTDVNAAGGSLVTDYSFEFDGVGDYFDCGTPPSVSSGEVSLSAWIYKDAAAVSYAAIVGTRLAAGVDMPYMLGLDNTGKGRFFLSQTDNTDISILTNDVLVNDTWTHLAAVADSTNTYLYVNGVVQTDVGSYDGTIITPDRNLYIGVQGLISFLSYIWTGKISDTALWSSALSAANILTIFNNGRPADLTSLSPVSWWRMGEEAFCPDYTASPNVWTIPDQTGSNDGTSAGNPDLVGEAPQSFANGLSVSMDIDDRIGESGFSDSNALSYNMDSEARKADVPG